MLITFSIYLIYLKNEYEQKLNMERTEALSRAKGEGDQWNLNNTNTTKPINNDTFVEILQKNAYIFIPILFLNALMLIFGYLGEINIIKEKIAVLCGFIPFILCFTIIYEKYAKYSEQGLILFWYFVSVWSLYGVAALFPYNLKNIFYNILDLFAKNFFGLYLAYIIWYNKI
jgi:hypothetical protein